MVAVSRPCAEWKASGGTTDGTQPAARMMQVFSVSCSTASVHGFIDPPKKAKSSACSCERSVSRTRCLRAEKEVTAALAANPEKTPVRTCT